MIMGVNKESDKEMKREMLYKQNGGKVLNGIKYPFTSKNKDNGGDRELNKIFLPKELKKKYEDYLKNKRNDDYDNLFNELIK
jgi:hypothetical protein